MLLADPAKEQALPGLVPRRVRKQRPPKERIAHLEETVHWLGLCVGVLLDELEQVRGRPVGRHLWPKREAEPRVPE